MTFDNLSEYLYALESAGELKRIQTEVSSELEVAEIMRRLMYTKKSPAILFENIKDFVLLNLKLQKVLLWLLIQ